MRQWEIWIIRITELEKKCQEKLGDLKSKGEPQDKTEVEDQIILAKVSFQSYVYANLYVAFLSSFCRTPRMVLSLDAIL